ncbi:MAG: hypothetical protein P4L45_08940, partial [Ignavibacteriaceae bacterium]|nr:hypothetical protein [Ignavibacteriaceae bacterium]
MKRITLLSAVLISLLFSVILLAQDTINVAVGYGTLNEAIKTNGGNKVYKLQAGGWYGLNA